MTAHHCHAEGCLRTVPPRMFACRRHWAMVPRWLQAKLWAAYRPGQERTKEITPWYVLVQTRCRLAITEAEGSLHASRVRMELAGMLRGILAEDAPERAATDEQAVEALDVVLREPGLGDRP